MWTLALEDTDRETNSAFHFVFIDPLIVFATRDAVGHAISAKEIRVVFGLLYLLIDYFTLVCLRGGQTGVLIHSNQIFLSMVLRCVRFARESSTIKTPKFNYLNNTWYKKNKRSSKTTKMKLRTWTNWFNELQKKKTRTEDGRISKKEIQSNEREHKLRPNRCIVDLCLSYIHLISQLHYFFCSSYSRTESLVLSHERLI